METWIVLFRNGQSIRIVAKSDRAAAAKAAHALLQPRGSVVMVRPVVDKEPAYKPEEPNPYAGLWTEG